MIEIKQLIEKIIFVSYLINIYYRSDIENSIYHNYLKETFAKVDVFNKYKSEIKIKKKRKKTKKV